ncbi:hypothetical protein TWF225_001935 [Orbilia oligospora]|uniref:Uncharacterized protein n=1 Tax=Orbilia oligospora TaxID=2813651 RepID=A0A7C8PUL3_ORBOL|nr:hypothetical protein TWF751_011583 [Orbilia oligospora]KAF3190974.1 hypothetical protein TWF225_001935 [Orbilia oligospora]KAF3262182.1 hypothetical protein TWF217_004252 [Orbilia oligospora]KAF3265332.1 hypothetical protein TWF128_000603 [Orbilia oligospora]KAF3293875.1 hypothetical protein TWF132_004457 [Orbilia oligospora]
MLCERQDPTFPCGIHVMRRPSSPSPPVLWLAAKPQAALAASIDSKFYLQRRIRPIHVPVACEIPLQITRLESVPSTPSFNAMPM